MMNGITKNPNETNWARIWRDFWITVCFITASNLMGFAFINFQQVGDKITAMLWALACLASGGIVGFLFGIPRVLQDNNGAAIVGANGGAAGAGNPPVNPEAGGGGTAARASQPFYRMQVNTNLEQISDWLTKIIVGVGLIELRRLPEFLENLSRFFAKGLSTDPALTQTIASAIIVYFVIVGFIGGYLMTRIYLAQAFSRADWGTQNTVMVGGQELTFEEVSEQQRKQLTDLQEQVIKVQTEGAASLSNETIEEKVVSGKRTKVKSILWVDDNPKNNSLHVQRLNELGIEVVLALSTADALEKLKSRTFDRIISDMGRYEANGYVEKAGIELVRAVRKFDQNTPILIFCSTKGVVNHKDEAIEAGANEITSSSTVLMKALQLES